MNHSPSIAPVRWDAMTVADKTAAITALVQEGQSAGQMGKALNASRNMILSHARRYKIQLASYAPPISKPKPAVRDVRKPMRTYAPLPAKTWAAHREPVSLLELTSTTCRWPVGDAEGSSQMYCGDHAGRRSYCERHAEMGNRS